MRYARRATDRAVVLVMVIGVLAALALAATAFAIFMNEANTAAVNSAYMAQAELAARSGLEHAIRLIEMSLAHYSYVSPTGAMDAEGNLYEDTNDPRSGWYLYLQGDEPIIKLGEHVIKGRRFELAWPASIKRAEYAIYIKDLDGLLHANLAKWTDNHSGGQSALVALVKDVAESCAGLTDGSVLATESAGANFSSLGELPRRTFPGPPSLQDKYKLQEWFTVYPMDNAPPRPAVNINTAPEALIARLLEPALVREDDGEEDSLSRAKAAALAKHLCAWRPFRGRHDFEDIVRRVSGDDAVDALPDLPDTNPYDNHLTERQFNDVLNNSAGEISDDESAYDELDNPGIYRFDGWEPFSQSGEGPYQTGGECSANENTTWSVEFKFTSRFFYICVLGRAWDADAQIAVATQRLQTIYDAESNKILWLRWNLSSQGSVADYAPSASP